MIYGEGTFESLSVPRVPVQGRNVVVGCHLEGLWCRKCQHPVPLGSRSWAGGAFLQVINSLLWPHGLGVCTDHTAVLKAVSLSPATGVLLSGSPCDALATPPCRPSLRERWLLELASSLSVVLPAISVLGLLVPFKSPFMCLFCLVPENQNCHFYYDSACLFF